MKWNEVDQQVCSVARALSIVGERWTLLIVRDAFKGTRRFDDFQRTLGVTRHRLAERLQKLIDEGVLTRIPYQDRPVRYEYRLTRKGLALYPVLVSLSNWADEWMDDGAGPPMTFWHSRCGKESKPLMTCSECGDPMKPEEMSPRLGSGLTAYVESCRANERTVPDPAQLPIAAMAFYRQYLDNLKLQSVEDKQ